MPSIWRYSESEDRAATQTERSQGPTDFTQLICDATFHRRIVCQRTGSPVTFAVGGDLTSNDVILYCLPSGCSRYLGLLMHGICHKAGFRIIAIDRPGSGGTPLCPTEDRLHTSLQQTISVLIALKIFDEHLRPLGPRLTFLAHSAGLLYLLGLLQYLRRSSSSITGELRVRSRILLSSPWVPTSVSKSSLALLPASVVRLGVSGPMGKVIGALSGSVGSVTTAGKSWVAWSSGGVKASMSGTTAIDGAEEHDFRIGAAQRNEGDEAQGQTTDRSRGTVRRQPSEVSINNPFLSVVGVEAPPSPHTKSGQKTRAEAQLRSPNADFWPPHDMHLKYSMSRRAFPRDPQLGMVSHPATGRSFRLDPTTGQQLVYSMMMEEGMRGVAQDFLLSLGHAPKCPSSSLERMIQDGITSLAHSPEGAEVTVVWAEGDKLVPVRGRVWLDDLFRTAAKQSAGNVTFDRLEMARAGHDMPIVSEAVTIELLRRAKAPPTPSTSSASRTTTPILSQGDFTDTNDDSTGLGRHPFSASAMQANLAS